MPNERKTRLDALAVASLVLCCFLWGLNQVAAKVAITEVPPLAQAAIRSLGASPGDRQAVVAQSLPRIQARALVLWGDDDRWIPIAHADRFVAAIPCARKVVIPACGHVPQEEKPEEVARLLLAFLAEAESQSIADR